MIIFINDDRAYLYWVTHHRQGFVLEGRRRPKVTRLVLHRATCTDIKRADSKRTHWTTGAKLKVCSVDLNELKAWAVEESDSEASPCEKCRPEREVPSEGSGEIHLTKLGADILDYVLDAALIHLDHEQPPYSLTVSEIAACFGKTPGQLSATLHRLVDDGLLTVDGRPGVAVPIPLKRTVWPTIRALRTLQAFQAESDEMIQAELAKLYPE
jgi:MarR family